VNEVGDEAGQGDDGDAPVDYTSEQHAWLSAAVLYVETLLFADSLVAAFAEGLTPRQSNGWI
jgi:hypothetical protein